MKLKEVTETYKVPQLYTGAGIQDLDKIPHKKETKGKVFQWIAKKISEGSSILKVDTAVTKVYGEKKGRKMIQEVLLIKNVQPTERNELCLTNYELSPGSSINKMGKCITCSFSDSLYCKKYNREFINSSVEIPPEVNEIMAYFQDQSSDGSIQIDPVQIQKPVDIEMANRGKFLSIDVHTEQNIDENTLWYEAQRQEMEVDTAEVIHFEDQLSIDMGEHGESMVLGDDLL